MHVDRLKLYSQRQFALKMTTWYCFTKLSEGYRYWEESHPFTDEKHAENYDSLLKLILTSVDTSLLSLLNSLHCSCVFCSSSTCCISGMFCHSYCLLGCWQVVSPIFLYTAKYMKGLIPFKQFYFANFKTTVKVVSWFWQKQNNLVGQLERFEIIVRHSLEISVRMTSWPPILPYYHEQQLWIPLSLSGISNPRPGLTPGTALRAVGSGINIELYVYTYPVKLNFYL